jgi:uncharacterized protein
MRAWVVKRPVISFYVLALALSWGYWLALLMYGRRVAPGSTATHFPGLLGPLIAALAVTAVIEGRNGVRDLFGRMVRFSSHWRTSLLLAISPLALGALAFGALGVLDRRVPSPIAFSHLPGLPESWPLAAVAACVLLVNGFGEEAGWRGFVAERLFPSHGRFRATFLTALLWSLWHLPLFWLNASLAALVGPVLIGWAFGLLCGSFVLAQVYLVAGRSILCVAIWHAAYNMVVATEAGAGLPAALVSTVVMAWGVIVAVVWWRVPPDDSTPNSSLERTSNSRLRRRLDAAHVKCWASQMPPFPPSTLQGSLYGSMP